MTNEVTDLGLLSNMAKRAKQALGVNELDAITDMGYYDGQQVKECLEAGVTPYIPKANTSANRKRGLFTKQNFTFDPEHDRYLCPAGQTLTYRFTTVEQEREIRYYATHACRDCPLRLRCTRNKRGRRITEPALSGAKGWVDEHLLEAMEARVQAEPEKVSLRKQLVEHRSSSLTGSLRNHQTVDIVPMYLRDESGLLPLTWPRKSQGRDGPDGDGVSFMQLDCTTSRG